MPKKISKRARNIARLTQEPKSYASGYAMMLARQVTAALGSSRATPNKVKSGRGGKKRA
jgi:hypothetical protein